MTSAPTSSQAPRPADTRSAEAASDVDPRVTQERRDRFEQLLHAKSARYGEPDDAPATPETGAAVLLPFPALLAARTPADIPSPAVLETAQTGPCATIEAALNAGPPAPQTPVGAPEPAAIWEASVREHDSVPVEVRFTRSERSAYEAQAGWTLTVGSPVVNAELLSRHAPRLAERLAKRSIGPTHVRIQREDGDA
jgi:hypothetical protein